MATASDFKVKKGLQVAGGDIHLGEGDDTEILVDVRSSGTGRDLTIAAGASSAGGNAGGSLKLRTAAANSLADRLVISPTATTISDGTFDFDVASHDGTSGLKLGGTLVTSTAGELNLIDGGTARGTTAVASGDGVLINDGGVMRMTNVDTLGGYFDDLITSMPNLATAAALTTIGTLGTLTVDSVNINGKVITMTGSPNDTTVMTAGTGGTLSIVTTDTDGAAANIQITADGTVDIDSAGVLTLDSGAGINIEPAASSAILLDGTISIDAGVVTGATSITSTALVGALTGNADTATLATTVTVTDNESTNEENALVFTADADADGGNLGLEQDHSGLTYNPSTGRVTATQLGGTLTTVAQGNVTSLGTLTALTVDDVAINGKVITITGDDPDTATFTGGAAGKLDIVTTDASGTDAHIQITANGTAELAGTTVTLDSGGGVTIDADSGTITFADDGSSLGTITSSGYSGYAKGSTVKLTATNSSDNTMFPLFVDTATGDEDCRTDTGYTYNPASGLLTATLFSGTVSQAAQTSITSLGTLTGLTGITGDLNWDAKTLWVDSSANSVGIGQASALTASALTVEGTIALKEQAEADGVTAAYGQLWVNTASPNELYFTTDADDDIQLTSGTAIASGGAADSVAADDISDGNAAVEIETSTGGVDISTDAVNQILTLGNTSGNTVINGLIVDINSAGVSTHDAVTSHTLTSPVSAITSTTSHTITSPATAVVATTRTTFDTPIFTVSSSTSASPAFTIENTNADANGPVLKLSKNGSSVADEDLAGTITFVSEDDGSNAQTYGSIVTSIADATAGAEQGKMVFNVAEYDGTVTQGLALSGGTSNGVIDVTLGAGTGSTTTVAGDLTVSGTTTTVSSTVLEITDDLITVSKGNDTVANADGSGMEIDATGATNLYWKYVHSNTAWTSNVDIDTATTSDIYKIAGTSVLTNNTLGSGVVSSSLTSVGALNSGSITSGFTSIDVGAGAISTTGLITGGSLDIDDVLINGTTIGHTDDTDLLTVADGALTLAGTLNQEGITLIDSYSATLTTTSATTLFTFASDTYSAAKVIVSVWLDDGSDNRSVSEYLLTYAGASTPSASSNIHLTEYAMVETGGAALATFDAVKSSGNILFQITPGSSTSTKVRAQITQFVI